MDENMFRSIEWWLNRLPSPYKEKAISNREANVSRSLNSAESFTEAITVAFGWGGSPEGDKYWRDLYKLSLNNQWVKNNIESHENNDD